MMEGWWLLLAVLLQEAAHLQASPEATLLGAGQFPASRGPSLILWATVQTREGQVCRHSGAAVMRYLSMAQAFSSAASTIS